MWIPQKPIIGQYVSEIGGEPGKGTYESLSLYTSLGEE